MDKQKQIEEMAKTYCQNGFNCGENCQTNGCRVYEVCTELYNAGYRKIPENAVVLTREEFEGYEKCQDLLNQYMKGEIVNEDVFCQQVEDIKKVRKETAEKFAERLKEKFAHDVERCKAVDEICKEITESKV